MRRSTVVLLSAIPLVASAACSQLSPPVALDRCPPRPAAAASSGARLTAGGKGIAPREAPEVDEGITSPPSDRLVSGGRGVPERVESASPSVAASAGTPHLVAGGRGVLPRTECQ